MAESPLGILIEMISVLLENTIGTLQSLFGLFRDFFSAMFGISQSGGFFPFLFSVVIIGIVLLFLAKFFFRSAKTILVMLAVGAIMVAVLFVSLV